MASRKTTGLFYNLILTLALFLLLMTSLLGLEIPTSVALEQSPRCGQAEHHHTEDCYLGEVLLCSRKAHTHSQSCYLVNLRDNDINSLLQSLSEGSDTSLEALIRSVMSRALDSSPEHSAESALTQLSQKDIATLNDTIRGDDSIPDLLLNQNLGTGITLQYTPIEPGIAVLAFPEKPSTANRSVNFYVMLDGKITLVHTGTLQEVSGWYQTVYAYSYSNTVKAFSDVLITSLTTNNISSYYFLYNTDGDISNVSDFGTNANKNDNYVRFSTYSSPRYVLLASSRTYISQGWGGYYEYTPADFYTVTLDYATYAGGANQVRYVQSGLSSGLTLSDQYEWVDENGNPATLPNAITGKTTLYARPKGPTVTFNENYDGGQSHNVTVAKNTAIPEDNIPDVSREGYTFDGWYTDAACSNSYHFGSIVSQNMTLYAKWLKNHNVTFHYQNNAADTTLEVAPGGTVSAPAAPTWEGHTFSGWYTDAACSDGNAYNFSTAVDADLDLYAKWIPNVYTVTVLNEDGSVADTHSVRHGRTFTLGTLPTGYVWADSDGDTYAPGVNITVTKNMTLRPAAKTITIKYDLAFPSNWEGDPKPTIYGTTATTANKAIPGGSTATVLSPSSRKVRDIIVSGTNESQTHYFLGWKIEGTDVLIQPGARISWEELEQYAGADGTVNLTGQWEKGTKDNSVSFYIRLDSVAVDTNGNVGAQDSKNYTPEIFHTYLGGDTDKQQNIADTTQDNSYGADQAIRALYGERDTGAWMYDFPNDDDMFELLREYNINNPNKPLSVDNVPVKTEELDKEHYAIRWYVFKRQGNSWHVDGKLVRREGTVTVDKNFHGEDEAIRQAKQGFYIIAENGTKNEDGSFTPYTGNKYRKVIMTLDQATANSLKAAHPGAEFLVLSAEEAAANALEWIITKVTLGEYWKITEKPNSVANYSYYAEYTVYDTNGEISARAENGTEVSVLGKTFALDEDPDQGLFVNFSNYYYPKESILLKKEDGLTGAGIGGAKFQVHQVHNGNDMLLKFNYDAETGIYSQDPDGTYDTIQTSDSGFVVIDSFSYQYGTNAGEENPNYLNGSIIITETVSPIGYSPAPEITLGLNTSNNVELKAVGDLAESKWADYAELPSNEVLEIRNYNTDYVSVTANKVWNTLTPEQSVEVVLQANGRHAALEIPSLAGAQVVLNAQNNWTYTWEKLPRYANGMEVTWSIKEVKVGDAPTMADGVSFANWVPTYSPATPTDTNGDGKTDNWSFTVTNTKRRPMLTITKVDTEGAILPGATFMMETVTLENGQWQVIGSQSRTTDGTGMTTFELVAGNYYRLTETSAPAGYMILAEPVVVTVDGTGLVQQVNTDGTLTALNVPYLTYTGVYNVRVTNLKLEPLPETGGAGTKRYAQSGLLLILLAAVLWIYSRLPGIPAAAAPRGQRRKFRQISTFRMLPPGPGPAPAEPVPRQGPKMHRKEESDTS